MLVTTSLDDMERTERKICMMERRIRILERVLRLTAETLAVVWGGDVSADAAIKRYTMLAEEQEN